MIYARLFRALAALQAQSLPDEAIAGRKQSCPRHRIIKLVIQAPEFDVFDALPGTRKPTLHETRFTHSDVAIGIAVKKQDGRLERGGVACR